MTWPAVLAALDRAKAVKGKPQAIVAQTIKGHGFSQVADKLNWHGKPFSKEQLAAAIQEMGGGPTVPPDPGKSYERTPLPTPPDFPAPPPPDYAADAKIATREAYGFALKRLGAVNPHVVAISGDVKNSTFSEIFRRRVSGPFLAGLHRGTKSGERRGGTAGARQGAFCRHVCVLPFARV